MATQRERVHALDGLRALAVAQVFMHHVIGGPLSKSLADSGHAVVARLVSSLGAAGVELFFCLSGVVLLRRYLQGRQPLDAGKYFYRRIARLYPPFVAAWLFAGVTIWVIQNHPTWWSITSTLPIFDVSGFLSEMFLGIGSLTAYNWAWWSLAPEMMFYVAVPLVVAGLQRTSILPRAVDLAFIGCAIVSTMSYALEPTARHEQLVWMVSHYAICFAAGLLLATRRLTAFERRASLVVALAFFMGALFSAKVSLHVVYALLFMPLIDLCMQSDGRLASFLGRNSLVWFGERSYSIFLTHFSVIYLSCYGASLFWHKGIAYLLVSRLLAVAGSVVVACLLFSLVERRFATGLTTDGQVVPWQLRPS